jgi:hypothetical protein
MTNKEDDKFIKCYWTVAKQLTLKIKKTKDSTQFTIGGVINKVTYKQKDKVIEVCFHTHLCTWKLMLVQLVTDLKVFRLNPERFLYEECSFTVQKKAPNSICKELRKAIKVCGVVCVRWCCDICIRIKLVIRL